MMKKILPLLFSIFLVNFCLMSCKNNQETTTADQPDQVAGTAVTKAPEYPSLSNTEVADMYIKADKVDIIFYHHPISVNQEDPASVKKTVLYVSPSLPRITTPCKPVARLTWMSQGSILREADVHCDAGCEYLVFMENNKPVYANAISPAGAYFFRNLIKQAEEIKQNVQ